MPQQIYTEESTILYLDVSRKSLIDRCHTKCRVLFLRKKCHKQVSIPRLLPITEPKMIPVIPKNFVRMTEQMIFPPIWKA